MQQACKSCPRLNLLPQRARVHFLLALRERADQNAVVVASKLLSYVVQCFPSQVGLRNHLHACLVSAVQGLRHALSGSHNDLDVAVELLNSVENTRSEDYQVVGSVDRLELLDSTAANMYCHHLNDMISSTNGLPGVPSSVLWGNQKLEADSVDDFIAAATSGLVPAVHVMDVDRMLPRTREQLLRGLQSKALKCPVLLMFGDQDGADSFSHYPAEVYDNFVNNARQHKSYASACWPAFRGASKDHSDGSSKEIFVVAGGAGSGKSTWIDLDSKHRGKATHTLDMKVVVHEGFDVAMILCEYQKVIQDHCTCENAPWLVILRLDVTPFGDLLVLGRFLHHLLTLGLLLDEKSGKSAALLPATTLRIYVELPAVNIVDRHGADACWPSASWSASKHPYIQQLPMLTVFVPQDHFISIKGEWTFVPDEVSRYVAACLHVYDQNKKNVDTAHLPAANNAIGLDDNQCVSTLDRFFRSHKIEQSKRIRSMIVSILCKRFKLLSTIQHSLRREQYSTQGMCYFLRYTGCITGMFELMIMEAIGMVSISAEEDDDGCVVFSILPNWPTDQPPLIPPESQFEMLVFSPTSSDPNLKRIVKLFPQIKVLVVQEDIKDALLAEIRAVVAPVFGMMDTGLMLRNLCDAGHLLTPDSLSRILYLHCRRSIRANVIFEGETGCGKSRNLMLYSHLINANADLFTNLKLHLLAIVQTAASHVLSTEVVDLDSNAEDENAYHKAAGDVLQLRPQCSVDALLQLVVAWIRLGERKLANQVGIYVCAYFLLVFHAFPLYTQGLNDVMSAIFGRFSTWVANNPEQSKMLKVITSSASSKHFLSGSKLVADRPWPTIGTPVDSSEHVHHLQLFADEDELEDFLQRLVHCKPASLYHRKLADAGLTPASWRAFIGDVTVAAEKVRELCASAVVCVFIDESNTAGAFGMVTEAFVSHTMDGKPIAGNIFFVGAMNPHRLPVHPSIPAMDFTASNIRIDGNFQRKEEDEQQDY